LERLLALEVDVCTTRLAVRVPADPSTLADFDVDAAAGIDRP
jgi:hypothetical protein